MAHGFMFAAPFDDLYASGLPNLLVAYTIDIFPRDGWNLNQGGLGNALKDYLAHREACPLKHNGKEGVSMRLLDPLPE